MTAQRTGERTAPASVRRRRRRRFRTKDGLIAAIVATQMEEGIEIAADFLEEDDPWRGIQRFLYEMAGDPLVAGGALPTRPRIVALPRRGVTDRVSATRVYGRTVTVSSLRWRVSLMPPFGL